ncbi:ubiquitin 3 binding protein But2 C-terminal domain-containing protein [Aspergillus californicus]
MRNFATLAAFAAGTNALVPRQNGCCFHITASGDASGSIGQLGDGQNRIGGGLTPAQYCIDSDGSITDNSGRGCILTPPTTQFQCDQGAKPTPGFSINSNGEIEYNGSTDFVACETGENGGLNLYTTPDSSDVTGCRSVTLNTDGCSGQGSGSGGSGSSSAPGMPSSAATVGSSTAPAGSPTPSTPGQGGGQGPGTSGGPGGEGPGTTAPGGGSSTATIPVVSPSPSSPGEGPGGGGGGEGPGPGSTTVIPVVTPSSSPSPSGPGGDSGQGSGDCDDCQVTSTIVNTVTVPCTSGTPVAPGPGETGPGGGGGGGGGGGPQPTAPGSTGPSGPGETGPSGPGSTGPGGGGGGPSSTGPSGPGSTGPFGPGETGPSTTGPSGPGETGPGGGGGSETPSGTQPPSSETPQPSSSGGSCPTDLSGDYEFPHLIIPVDSSSPNTAAGTQFNGSVSDTVSTIFNFDIPQSDAGKTCSLVFLFPKQEDLETSAFTFSGDGKVQFGALESPASESTTYNNAPAVSQDYGEFTISPGNSYSVSSFECPAGQAVGFEMTSSGSTNLEFFEDYNPSPLGLYITVC